MNYIIYLDLCKHPVHVNISDVRCQGQDDPLTLTPTGSRNPQGSTRPLGLSLTPHHQQSSPGITVTAPTHPSSERQRSPILTTSITTSTVSTAMPRNLTPKKGRITRSAVHEEFNEVIVFNRRLKKNVNGRKCKHCDSEFSGKNKTNLEDHLRVFHKEEYQKALGKILNCC